MTTNYDQEIKQLKKHLRENYDLLYRWQLKLILAHTPQELKQYRQYIRQIKREVANNEEQLALILSEKNNRLMAVSITERTAPNSISNLRFLGVIGVLSMILLFLYNKPNLFLFDRGSNQTTETGLQNIKSKYDWVSPYRDGLAKVRKGHLFGFIDKHGKVVIPIKYEDAWDFRNNLTRVQLEGRYGFIDTSGKIIIPIKYDKVFDFNDHGMAQAKIGTAWFYINKLGKCIKNCPKKKTKPKQENLAGDSDSSK
ncbi:WG repeat-containing protein [uncultured Microscilla sp.]|uniref:WG repeat-containing protein n=1 Tax=uncultured Microscilla sp. TaxID=432653 RepID=UPI00260D4764|nr:WG repeat-containing protein [uncultured Microscilla sp.]